MRNNIIAILIYNVSFSHRLYSRIIFISSFLETFNAYQLAEIDTSCKFFKSRINLSIIFFSDVLSCIAIFPVGRIAVAIPSEVSLKIITFVDQILNSNINNDMDTAILQQENVGNDNILIEQQNVSSNKNRIHQFLSLSETIIA